MEGLFLDVLESTATKREARSYLSRYTPRTTKPERLTNRPAGPQGVGVNLGSLYPSIRSVDESPVFAQTPADSTFDERSVEPLHVALVKLKAPQSVDKDILKGVGHTLSQLTSLGLSCVVVVDPRTGSTRQNLHDTQTAAEQADNVVAAIDGHGGQGARRLDGVLVTVPLARQLAASVKVRGGVRITNRDLILAPLRRGLIPVVAPITFAADTLALQPVASDEVVLALTREFAGLQTESPEGTDPFAVAEKITVLQKQASLDRLIILDPLGGIPSTDRSHGAHVFINLEQEYEGIRQELLGSTGHSVEIQDYGTAPTIVDPSQVLTLCNPFSKFVETGVASVPAREQQSSLPTNASFRQFGTEAHIENLDLLKSALGLLPPSSSGLLTTLQEAANLRPAPSPFSEKPGVGTRPRRNPLIHNLLTDKPVLSPSLPTRPAHLSAYPVPASAPATFVKRGMPVSIIPDPRTHPWEPPTPSSPALQLSDPRLDLARLIHLIENSFNRTLDVPHYLSRIENRIAGIIVCGEYEGGALLTWEPPVLDCPPERLVPYLDKFAVLKRSQGAGGVADIVFNAMVRDCFPDGVCWRSRRDNPVNKWYFERAKGTWKMPATNWTMFWTTEGVEVGREGGVFRDYEAVCKNVMPSWADTKAVVD